MRRDLLRSGYSAETNQQQGAIIALVGRLVDLGATLAYFTSETENAVRRRYDQLAERIEGLSDFMFGTRKSGEQELPVEPAPPGTPPLLLEMERTVSVIAEVLSGSDSRGGYEPAALRA